VTCNIRTFRSHDRYTLERAIDAVCGEGRWMATARFEPTPAWQHALTHPGCGSHLLLVAEAQDEVVGWCRLFPVDGPSERTESTEMARARERGLELGIGLLPAFRGQGLGRELVEGALRWVRAVALPAVHLTTRRDNARALGLFARCGFLEAGEAGSGEVAMCYHVEQAHELGRSRDRGQDENGAI